MTTTGQMGGAYMQNQIESPGVNKMLSFNNNTINGSQQIEKGSFRRHRAPEQDMIYLPPGSTTAIQVSNNQLVHNPSRSQVIYANGGPQPPRTRERQSQTRGRQRSGTKAKMPNA